MDDTQALPATPPKPSIPLAVFGAAIVMLNLWIWSKSSDVSYLIAAVSFAALTPGFYFSPISFRKSFMANAEAIRTTKQPGWVAGSTITGFALLFASLAVRWLG
jgi:hypothetical protein